MDHSRRWSGAASITGPVTIRRLGAVGARSCASRRRFGLINGFENVVGPMVMADRGRNRGMKAVMDFSSMVLSRNRGRLKPRISSSAGRRRSRHGQGDLATVGVVVAHADLVVDERERERRRLKAVGNRD